MTITDDYSFNTFASMIEAINDEDEIEKLYEGDMEEHNGV